MVFWLRSSIHSKVGLLISRLIIVTEEPVNVTSFENRKNTDDTIWKMKIVREWRGAWRQG